MIGLPPQTRVKGVGRHNNHMVETYSSMGLVIICCEDRFLLFPHVVEVSGLSICIVLRAFVVVISMGLLYVSFGVGSQS